MVEEPSRLIRRPRLGCKPRTTKPAKATLATSLKHGPVPAGSVLVLTATQEPRTGRSSRLIAANKALDAESLCLHHVGAAGHLPSAP